MSDQHTFSEEVDSNNWRQRLQDLIDRSRSKVSEGIINQLDNLIQNPTEANINQVI